LKLPGQDSNLDKENQKTFLPRCKSIGDKASRPIEARFARRFAQIESDPDLARLIDAWPTLPEPIRRAMLALLS
jgi:hypothetical protein